MSPQEWQRAKAVLSVAAGLGGSDGMRLVAARFPDEPTLRAEVLGLLDAHGRIANSLNADQLASLSASVTAGVPATIGPADTSQALDIGAQYGPYRVARALGAGGMGQVFLAEDVRLGRQVALKSLAGRWLAAPTARQRLLSEARAIAALSHPNIATLYDVLEDERHLMLVMEYVEGRTAADLIADGPLPLGQALRLALQITDAVVYAHDRGIIHCDLKPLNVQVSVEGTAKVLDFGLARATVDSYQAGADEETRPLTLVGTPPYMPPERWLTGTLNASGDLYSLGVTIFELVTGRRPFVETDFAALMGAILGTTAPAPSSIAADCPARLDRVVGRALERDTKKRYHSARELSRDLREVLQTVDTETVVVRLGAEAGAAPGRVRTAFARRPILTSLGLIATAALVLTLMGLIITTTFNRTFGLNGPFALEAPQWLLVWGARSLVTPILYITAMVIAAQAIRVVVRAISLLPAVEIALTAGGRRLAAISSALRLGDPIIFGQWLILLGFASAALVLWEFRDLFTALTRTINDAAPELLVPLAPGGGTRRSIYRIVLDVPILLFGLGAFRVIRLRREGHVRDGAAVQGVVIALVVVFILLNIAPLRVFFHAEFDAANVNGARCYIIKELTEAMLTFCPEANPPRNRVLAPNDPSMQRLGLIENVFTPLVRATTAQ